MTARVSPAVDSIGPARTNFAWFIADSGLSKLFVEYFMQLAAALASTASEKTCLASTLATTTAFETHHSGGSCSLKPLVTERY